MRDFDATNRFRKDWKKLEKQGLDMTLLKSVMHLIITESEEIFEDQYKLHKLSPKNQGNWECHVSGRTSDWLLIFKIYEDKNLVVFTRTGVHAELFR